MPVQRGAVPLEAVAFLGAVLFFVLLLILFFLYLNKSLCFSECGGFPCIDKIPQKNNDLDAEEDDQVFYIEMSTPPHADEQDLDEESGAAAAAAASSSPGHGDQRGETQKTRRETIELHGGTIELHRGTIELSGGTLEVQGGTIELQRGTIELEGRKRETEQAAKDRARRELGLTVYAHVNHSYVETEIDGKDFGGNNMQYWL